MHNHLFVSTYYLIQCYDIYTYLCVNIVVLMQNYIENLVRQAHANWNSLEAVDTMSNETALLTQGIYLIVCNCSLLLDSLFINLHKLTWECWILGHVEDQHYPQTMMVRALDHQVINNGQQQLADIKCINNVGAAGYPQSNTMMGFECSDNWQISSPYLSFSPLMDTAGVIKCSTSADSSSSDGDLGSQGL